MRSPHEDSRSVDELISAVLSESGEDQAWDLIRVLQQRGTREVFKLSETDEDQAWDLIWVLQQRGTREVFERALELCRSFCTVERKLGATILGQLGVPHHSFPKSSLEILLGMLEAEQDRSVISSVLFALSHLRMPEAIGPAVRFRGDSDPDVRDGVVHVMMGHEDPLAIEVLIGLTRDQETYIRDWACFALGTQVEVDTPDVRDALAERLNDEADDARCEALVGLARRKDQRVILPLLGALSSKSVWSLEVEAASLIADPRLYPELIALRGWWDVDEELLEEAILACSPLLESLA